MLNHFPEIERSAKCFKFFTILANMNPVVIGPIYLETLEMLFGKGCAIKIDTQ